MTVKNPHEALRAAIGCLEAVSRTVKKEGKWEPVAPSCLDPEIAEAKAALAALLELPEPVAYRLLRRDAINGEWKTDGRHWRETPAPEDLLPCVAKNSGQWRIEYAYPAQAKQAPAKREPMNSDDFQSAYVFNGEPDTRHAFVMGCRAAEAHHHIGGGK